MTDIQDCPQAIHALLVFYVADNVAPQTTELHESTNMYHHYLHPHPRTSPTPTARAESKGRRQERDKYKNSPLMGLMALTAMSLTKIRVHKKHSPLRSGTSHNQVEKFKHGVLTEWISLTIVLYLSGI